MDLELGLVRFRGGGSATEAFVAARDRSGAKAPWTREVGLVEHHHDGHLVLRGTFAGHYVDVDEALHVSERGLRRALSAAGWSAPSSADQPA